MRQSHEPWLTYNISRMAGMIRPGLARNAKILPRKVGKSFSTVSWMTSYILFFPLERRRHIMACCKAHMARDCVHAPSPAPSSRSKAAFHHCFGRARVLVQIDCKSKMPHRGLSFWLGIVAGSAPWLASFSSLVPHNFSGYIGLLCLTSYGLLPTLTGD